MHYRLRLADANLLDAEIVACEHVNTNAVALHELACLRHPSEPLGDETADRSRFQIFFRPETGHEIAHARQGEIAGDDEAALPVLDHIAIRLMLVADLADDDFEQVF